MNAPPLNVVLKGLYIGGEWVPGAGDHPHVIQAIHWLNPLSPAVEAVRAPLFLGELPAWGDALYLVVACAAALALGAFVFTRVDDQIAIEV